jgi:hypothetical protein
MPITITVRHIGSLGIAAEGAAPLSAPLSAPLDAPAR